MSQLVENPNADEFMAKIRRRKKIVIIIVTGWVLFILLCVSLTSFLYRDNEPTTSQPAAVEQPRTKSVVTTVAKPVPMTHVHEVQLNTVIKHRFVEGDVLRHVSGNPDYDCEVRDVNRYLMDDGSVKISYDLDFDHWVGSLNGYEKLPAPFVDACYNKL
jgi:hypothetical protein